MLYDDKILHGNIFKYLQIYYEFTNLLWFLFNSKSNLINYLSKLQFCGVWESVSLQISF